jgi:hypothetical protein
MSRLDIYDRLGWRIVAVPSGIKGSRDPGWPDLNPSTEELERHLDRDGNVAVIVGRRSGGLADVDLDCSEALALADLYLPQTGAEFGRASRPRSHRLYTAPGATFTALADPLDGTMLLELRADGRDGGAHQTLLPPSLADGERREWHVSAVDPAVTDPAKLTRCAAWLAIGCLMMRYVSEHAARRPQPDLLDILWEANPALGRRAYHWLGHLAPDEKPRDLKPRRNMSHTELRLEEIVAAIPNNCSWDDWNRIGMAIYAASGGSEQGFVAFDDFSSRSPKYCSHAVQERWRNYRRRSPPNRITLGSLVYRAQEAGWRRGTAA